MFPIELLLSDRIPAQMLYVFMVIDSDVYSISGVGSGLTAGTIEVGVDLVSQSISLDRHDLTFYAVNDIGFISDGYCISVTVFAGATSTPVQSPRSTVSPLASQSIARYQTSYPTAYPIVLNLASSSSVHNFNVGWRAGGSLIQTTWGNSGWNTIVRVVSSTGQVAGGQSVVVNGFTVETRNLTLGYYTILIGIRI
jgi:hypothetical protein